MGIDEAKWFRTDIFPEVIASSIFVQERLSELDEHNDWRWITIGSALLLQNCCVAVLDHTHTASMSYLSKKSAEEWSEFYGGKVKRPPKLRRLESPIELLKKCRKERFLNPYKPLDISEKQFQDCQILYQFRHAFIHFSPKSWSIETSGFPRIITSATNVSKKLIDMLPSFNRYINPKDLVAMRTGIQNIAISIERI